VPICTLLSVYALFLKFLYKIIHTLTGSSPKKPTPKRLLFIELSEMGSAFLAYPTLKRAAENFGAENIFFLIFTKNRESVDLLKIIPHQNVITISDKSFVQFAFGTLTALFKIWQCKVDTTIDMELFSRATAIISFFSGAKIRVGFDNFTDEGLFRGTFITNRVLLNIHHHISLNFLALYEGIFSDNSELPQIKKNVSGYMCDLPHLTKSQEDKEKTFSKLQQLNPKINKDSKLVVLNPDPGLLSLRGWSTDSYKQAARELIQSNSNLFIVLMGLPRSKDYDKLVFPEEYLDRCVNFCGHTYNLEDVITLFNVCHLLISNDSGPGHLASLARIPAVVLFGPESPAKYGPLGNQVTSLFANLSCSPCYSAANHRHSICTNNRCLQAISVNQVVNAASKYL
jgi:ADP-heptose:LPS heptosyltransferase